MAKGAYIGVGEPVAVGYSLGDVAVGSTIKLKENGVAVDYLVVHQGKPNSDLYDKSCKGTWVMRKDLYTKTVFDRTNYVNDYANSPIRTLLNGTFFGLFDSTVQSAIKEVKIPYIKGYGGKISALASGDSGLSTKVFLLNGREVGLTSYNGSAILEDGVKLDYFTQGETSAANTLRKATYNGTATQWWTRSPMPNDSSMVILVAAGGGVYADSTDTSFGVRPAFVLSNLLTVGSDNLITGEMAETTVGEGVARKIKKGYVGIENLARKIKKAYIGIGGVARPCWSGGELAAYGTITPLSKAREQLAATSVGNYALFAGGDTGSYTSCLNTVDAYDRSLTRTTPTTLSKARQLLAGGSIGDYAVFAGGAQNGSYLNAGDAYNSSLTRTVFDLNTLSVGRQDLASARVGNYLIFGGGRQYYSTGQVDAYDGSLTKATCSNLSSDRGQLAAASIGNYALFGGGYDVRNENSLTTVDAYNTSLTRSSATALNIAAHYLGATYTTNHAVFAGGEQKKYGSSNGFLTTVTAYDKSLTKSTPTSLSATMYHLSATSLAGNALFGGGNNTVVNAYDENLTLKSDLSISVSGYAMAAVTIGNYALFGGGHRGYIGSEVDAFTVA